MIICPPRPAPTCNDPRFVFGAHSDAQVESETPLRQQSLWNRYGE